MKFFLVKDVDDSAIHWSGERIVGTLRSLYVRPCTRKVDIIPVSQKSCEVEKCALLKKFLLGADESNDRDGFWSCQVDVGVLKDYDLFCTTVWYGSLEILKRTLPEKDCLGQLAESFEGAKVQVDWNMKDNKGQILYAISTGEMDLCCKGKMGLINRDSALPPQIYEPWKTSKPIFNRLAITVTISDETFYACCGSVSEPIPVTMPITILEEAVFSDVTILCGDGTEIKAHRNFLAARSPVFTAMFQTDMKEARESVVEIVDMEATSVRAFLKLLYYNDTSAAEGDLNVAFELFQASHKYGVKFAEEHMKTLILNKPNTWFDADAALKLFLFARNLTPAEDQLTRKMAKVLRSHFATMEESPVMQELFRTDCKAALELLKYVSLNN